MTSDVVSVLKLSTRKETRGRTGESGKGQQDCASEVRWVGVSGRESGQTGSNRGKSDPSVERPVRCSKVPYYVGECAARGYLGLYPMGRSVGRLRYGKKDGYLNQLVICASGHCTFCKGICSGSYPLGTLPHPYLTLWGRFAEVDEVWTEIAGCTGPACFLASDLHSWDLERRR